MPSLRCVFPSLVCAFPLLVTGCPDTDDSDSDGGASATAGDDTTTGTPPGTGTQGPADSGSGDGSGTGGTADDTAGTADDTAGSDDSGSGDTGTTGAVECGPPVELGVFTPTDGDARGFAVAGDTVFVAVTSAGLEAVDISDAAAPASLGAVDFGTGELAFTVAVAGDYAYVGQRGAGWKIVDVSDPAAMVEVASEDTDDAEDVAVVDNTFFVINGDGIRTYDVTDPTMPTALAATVVLPGAANALAISGDTAYVSASGAGLVAVDITDPSTPAELSVFDTSANATHVATDGTTVFASHADGVNVLDMTDPSMPVELGLYERDRSHAVAVDGSTLFVLGDDTASAQVPFLAVVDITDPAAPLELDISFDDFEDPSAVRFDGGRLLFTAEDDESLHIVDPCPAM